MSENELGLTVFETECYNKHYENLEKLSDGRLSGTILRDLFKTSLLPTLVLKEIWEIADSANRGSLTKHEFFKCLRLIAHAQDKKQPSEKLVNDPAPLPKFHKGSVRNKSGNLPTPINTNSGEGIENENLSPLEGNVAWYMTPEEREKYNNLFLELHPENSVVPGQKVRDFLLQSNLPPTILSQIWKLADINQDGFLSQEEFAIAMHLVYAKLAGQEVPIRLPLGLIPPTPVQEEITMNRATRKSFHGVEIGKSIPEKLVRRHSRSVSVDVPSTRKFSDGSSPNPQPFLTPQIQTPQMPPQPPPLNKSSQLRPFSPPQTRNPLSKLSQVEETSQESDPNSMSSPPRSRVRIKRISSPQIPSKDQNQNQIPSQFGVDQTFQSSSQSNIGNPSQIVNQIPTPFVNKNENQTLSVNNDPTLLSKSPSSLNEGYFPKYKDLSTNPNLNLSQQQLLQQQPQPQTISLPYSDYKMLLNDIQELKKELKALSSAFNQENQQRVLLQQEVELLKQKLEKEK